MTHEERIAKIQAENDRKAAVKAEMKDVKASTPNPKSILDLFERVKKIEEYLNI